MRTMTVLLPQSMSLRPWTMFLRARSLSSGATASSQSRNTTSAAERAAFSNRPGFDPGTASSERCTRAVGGSIVVKLMVVLLEGSAGGSEAAGDAIDGYQERCLERLPCRGVRRAAVPAQQLDLHPVRLPDGRQLAQEPGAELRETGADPVAPAHAQQHLAGECVLTLDHSEDRVPYPAVAHQAGVVPRDCQIHLLQGLFDLVDDQAEQA